MYVNQRKLSMQSTASAWGVKRLVSFVMSSGLSTMRSVDEFGNSGSEITSEWEARNAVQKIFKNVAKPGAKFPFFEGALETRQIRKSAFRNWVIYSGVLIIILVLLCVGTITAVPTPLRPNVPATPDAPTHLVYFSPPPPPPPPSPRAPPSHHRHRPRPWVVTIIVVSILGAIGSGGGVYYFMRQRNCMTLPQARRTTHSIEFGDWGLGTAATAATAVRDAMEEAFGGAFGGK